VPGSTGPFCAEPFASWSIPEYSGIRQFIDLGSGIPTVGNVHEIAQRADPECRVVYVDKEPIACGDPGDARDADYILDHMRTRSLLDFDQPIGLLMLWVLHFIPDRWDPVSILSRYRDRLAPASYLAITHITIDGNTPGLDEVLRLYRSTPNPAYARSHEEVLGLFAGFELVEPGLVGSAYWRPTGPGDLSSDTAMNTVSYGVWAENREASSQPFGRTLCSSETLYVTTPM
jgi:S-adenosyl methyltransferase